jgi:hypothetical protein
MAYFASHVDDVIDVVCSADPSVGKDGPAEMLPKPDPVPDGATVYSIRPLSWLESQRFDGVAAAEQIAGVIALGLVAVDGDKATAEKVRSNPHPAVAVPLYGAIMRLTWGGFFSREQAAAPGSK